MDLGDDVENWMARLPEELCTGMPLVHLAIPGSHVSGSYSIEAGADVSPDVNMFGSSLLKPAFYNWAVTQSASFKQQLNDGVRYLDLRLASKPETDKVFVAYGLYGRDIDYLLNEARVFLDHHKEEVIILDFREFHEFTDSHHLSLKKRILKIFEGKLCPLPEDLYSLTLASMRKNSHQVVVIYRQVAVEDFFWPSSAWPVFEPTSSEPEAMMRELEWDIAHRPSKATGYTSLCAIVPNLGFSITNSMSSLMEACVKPCDDMIIPWTKIQRPGHAGFNVIATDFVDRVSFCKTVVKLNKKLMLFFQNQNSSS